MSSSTAYLCTQLDISETGNSSESDGPEMAKAQASIATTGNAQLDERSDAAESMPASLPSASGKGKTKEAEDILELFQDSSKTHTIVDR